MRRAVAALLLLSMPACMMWHPHSVTEIGPETDRERVRITRQDGSSVVLEYATLRADSVTGVEDGGAMRSVPLADVHTLERWGLDPGFLLVPVIIVGIVLASHLPLEDGASSSVVD
jgi:hypothetical protein